MASTDIYTNNKNNFKYTTTASNTVDIQLYTGDDTNLLGLRNTFNLNKQTMLENMNLTAIKSQILQYAILNGLNSSSIIINENMGKVAINIGLKNLNNNSTTTS